jgi:HEAT repeat protein
VIATLVGALWDSDRLGPAEALTKIGPMACGPLLIALRRPVHENREYYDTRDRIAGVLGSIADQATFESLVSLLRPPTEDKVRRAAAAALAATRRPEAIGPLVAAARERTIAERIARVLEDLLASLDLAAVPEGELQGLARLADLEQVEQEWDEGRIIDKGTRRIDCTPLRLRAREELARRAVQ